MKNLHFQVIQERKNKWSQPKQNSHKEQEYDDIGKWDTETRDWAEQIVCEVD